MTDDRPYEPVGPGWREIEKQRRDKRLPGSVLLPLYRMRDLPAPFRPSDQDTPTR